MTFTRFFRPAAALVALALAFVPATTRAEDFSADWQAVQEANTAKLPQTALAALDKIIPRALAAKDDNTAIKAILTKAAVAASTERRDTAALTQIRNIAAYRTAASPALRAMLDAALARSWQNYYDANRWKLLERTRAAVLPAESADPVRPEHEVILTWDAARVRKEIHRYYTLALADAATLKKTPVSAFAAILREGTRPDALRPTLFDFLLHDAIAFYSLGEQGDLQSEDQFEPAANSPLLGSLEEFIAWNPGTPSENSPVLRAITLYQTALRFRLADSANPAALADADLSRILWAGKTLGDAEGTSLRVEQALRAHIERWKHHEASAETAADLALHLNANAPGKGDSDSDSTSPAAALEAYRAASLGIALHPQSAGAKRCRSIIAYLEDPGLASVATESVWSAPLPQIAVRYKNLETVHFRAIPANWHDFLSRDKNRPSSLSESEFALYARKAPDLEWTASLPKTDYAWRTHRIAAPEGLKPGFYFIVASANKNFALKNNVLAAVAIHVSDLALINVPVSGGNISGYVLNAVTGTPVAGATVAAWSLNNEHERVKITPVTTDATGAFSLKSNRPNDILLLASDATGHQVTNESDNQRYYRESSYNRTPERTRFYVHFITDRAIYRPGQNIQFKAIVFSANRDTNQYEIAPNRRVTVALDDPNGKSAATLELRTNAYGSAHGSFTVPAGRLNGAYTLHTTGAENGRTYLRVEEYKHPKFTVALAAPAVAPKLDAPVTLTGTATAYTGAPVDGAKVRWSVTRNVRWPLWCWWNQRHPAANARAIARGTATTDSVGKFSITFPALPDKSADPKDEPVFTYSITAEVTDTTGETRDASRALSIGQTVIQATLTVADWQTTAKPVSVKITTTDLNGEPVPKTTGRLTFYALKQPDAVHRAAPKGYTWGITFARNDLSDPNNWEEDDGVLSLPVVTDAKGTATVSAPLPVGIYRAVLTTVDRFGTPVSARAEVTVLDPAAPKSVVKVPFSLAAEKTELQLGDTFSALWGSGYPTARALVSIEQRGKVLQRFWTSADRTQQRITLPVTEDLRGGFTLRVWQVRENRFYESTESISVPWTNKRLDIGWERFRSKLAPGARETWTLKIAPASVAGTSRSSSPERDAPATSVPIPELAAALYDLSLDQFSPHQWSPLNPFYENSNYISSSFSNALVQRSPIINQLVSYETYVGRPATEHGTYRHWNPFDIPTQRTLAGRKNTFGVALAPATVSVSSFGETEDTSPLFYASKSASPGPGFQLPGASASPDLSAIATRTNLNETAFFFPALVAEADGTVRLEFTAPEALTRWKFLAFAHDKQLRSGTISNDTIITAKDFMVQPNPPRFVREGDTIEITVKLTNKTDAAQTGRIRLNFSDALSLDSADARLANTTPERAFTLAPQSSQTLSWRIRVPDGQGYLVYKAVGAAGLATDGEEGFLPVLSRRQLATESIAFSLSGSTAANAPTPATPLTRTFPFQSLRNSVSDTTLRHESLTVQVTSNPAWNAVLALPYLMETDGEDNEQLFSRYYANALAHHIAGSDPKIARVFEQWKNTPALESALFKNEDLKSILIAETPWVRAAEGESTQRRNIGILFDKNRTDSEQALSLKKLAERQRTDGRWSWCPDGPGSDFITLHIVSGLGHLRHLGVAAPKAVAPLLKSALPALDAALAKEFERVKADAVRRGKDYREENNLTPRIAHQLYARSFFIRDTALSDAHAPAYDYYFEQGTKYWTSLSIQSQAHLALAAHRKVAPATLSTAILRSLRERAKTDSELGVYWAQLTNSGWFWYQAPIETHALLIEAFTEIAPDAAFLDDLRLWLLRQKQTQSWSTTKSTADAIYALLLTTPSAEQDGKPAAAPIVPIGPIPILSNDALVTVRLGERPVVPRNVEAGTGFYSERIPGSAITTAMSAITVTKTTPGVSWGSVTWQYHQNLENIRAHAATPLKLKKTLWKKVRTAKGDELLPLPAQAAAAVPSAPEAPVDPRLAWSAASPVALVPGDTVVVRLELHTDRDMEFVHLKDQRPSGAEPVNVLSGYRWKGGVGRYETTRDTATHFFIDWLPAGTHLFEYPVRIQHKGSYESGIAEIQSMYAPEFNAHSASTLLLVK